MFKIPLDDKLIETWRGSPWDQKRTDSESDINPFQTIPVVLLEAIIQSLCSPQYTMDSKYFNIRFLITTELQKLNAPSYPYDYEQFSNFFPKLEKLQVLVLSYSKIDDSCLKIIGTWCKILRILDVHECDKLTDTGIEWLVPKTANMSKTLQELLVTCPAVTKKGIIMALQNCPALRVVENDHIFDCLVEMAQSAELAQQHLFTRLLLCPVGEYSRGQLGLVVRYCPSLFFVTIYVKEGLVDTDLFCLTSLKNLQILKFRSSYEEDGEDGEDDEDEDQITFDLGLVPVLKVIGSSLQVLDLSYFEFVDIWTLVKFCPNLISLTLGNHCQSLSVLSENEIIQLRNEKGQVYFRNLKDLFCGFNLSNDILFDLLSCPLLESVYIEYGEALTDDLLQQVTANGFLRNLKFLSLEYCDLVTKQGLDPLVTTDNHLEQINFHFCEKITQQNIWDWQNFARRQNWKLCLEFQNVDTEITFYYEA